MQKIPVISIELNYYTHRDLNTFYSMNPDCGISMLQTYEMCIWWAKNGDINYDDFTINLKNLDVKGVDRYLDLVEMTHDYFLHLAHVLPEVIVDTFIMNNTIYLKGEV